MDARASTGAPAGCIALAVLTALGRETRSACARTARANGLTVTEISEVLLHTAVYAGVPAYAVAQHVRGEEAAET